VASHDRPSSGRSATRRLTPVRTHAESDYLLGVADETRLDALRFRCTGDAVFQAPLPAGVPAQIELARLMFVAAENATFAGANEPPRPVGGVAIGLGKRSKQDGNPVRAAPA